MFSKIIKSSFLLILIAVFVPAAFAFVSAADDPPPPRVCGDSIVQSPNATGQFEKCDDSGEVEVLLANGKVLLGR